MACFWHWRNFWNNGFSGEYHTSHHLPHCYKEIPSIPQRGFFVTMAVLIISKILHRNWLYSNLSVLHLSLQTRSNPRPLSIAAFAQSVKNGKCLLSVDDQIPRPGAPGPPLPSTMKSLKKCHPLLEKQRTRESQKKMCNFIPKIFVSDSKTWGSCLATPRSVSVCTYEWTFKVKYEFLCRSKRLLFSLAIFGFLCETFEAYTFG